MSNNLVNFIDEIEDQTFQVQQNFKQRSMHKRLQRKMLGKKPPQRKVNRHQTRITQFLVEAESE